MKRKRKQEHVRTMRKFEGKRSRGRQRIKILDDLVLSLAKKEYNRTIKTPVLVEMVGHDRLRLQHEDEHFRYNEFHGCFHCYVCTCALAQYWATQ